MKKLSLVLVLVALGVFFLVKPAKKAEAPVVADGVESNTGAAPSASVAVKPIASAPAAAAKANTDRASDTSSPATREEAFHTIDGAPVNPPAAAVVESNSDYFPGAPVLSEVTEDGPKKGQTKTIRNVETSMAQGIVRLEEVREVKNGKSVVVDQRAMVSNQVLLKRPAGVSQDSLFAGLRQAGAQNVEPRGNAVLATFPAQANDPKALDTYLGSVRNVLGANVVVEPNFLRKVN